MNSLTKLSLCALFVFTLSRPSSTQTSSPPASSSSEVCPTDAAWKSAHDFYRRKQWAQAENAFDAFRRRFAQDPRSLEALRLSGVCRLQRGDTQGAIRAWSFILRIQPTSDQDRSVIMQSAINLYDAWKGGRDQGNRERLLLRLLSEFPREEATVRLHAEEGMIRIAEGDFAGAVRFLSPVSERLGEKERKHFELASALSSKGGAPDYRLVLDVAEESYANDEVEEAVRLYRALLKQNLDRNMAAETKTKLGWCLYTQGKWPESEKLWESVIKDAASGSEWVARSRWHMIQLMAGYKNEPEQAVEFCEEQAKEFADTFSGEQAMVTKAWLYWIKKDWEKASKAFNELVEAYPLTLQHEPIRNYIRDCEEGMRAKK